MNDKKLWIIISAISGFIAVAIGAFGAHGLREKLSEQMLEVYKLSLIHISEPRDRTRSRMPSSA